MVNCVSLMKSVLVAIVLVAVVGPGSAAEKLASCCTKVTNLEIKEPILGYLVQERNPPCVRAVIFQTETGLFCSQLTAPWVGRKIMAFRKAKAQSTTRTAVPKSTVSLLSIITSTASTPSSSAPSSSLPLSSSETPSSSSLPLSSSETPSSSSSSSETPSSSSSSSSLPLSSSSSPLPLSSSTSETSSGESTPESEYK